MALRFGQITGVGTGDGLQGPLEVRGPAEVGDVVGLDIEGRVAEVLAPAGSARAALYGIAAELGLDPYFSDAVESETSALAASGAIGDPSLDDRTAQPFCTIDGPHSRDLDQALYLERKGDGFVLHYALADAAHFVARGSALFADAMARGASYYFPGFAIPMLPRPLSEGLISLNPDGPRRALVFSTELNAAGEHLHTSVARARIRSRKKLAWKQVQQLYDFPERAGPLASSEIAPSLGLLRELGELLLDRAESRDLVRYHREEVDVSLDSEGLSFVVERAARERVELYNEQLSLLVNGEGARLLREHPSPDVEPIYRVHPAPDAERLENLRLTLEHIAAHHHLPERFVWKKRSSLARYIANLPHPDDGSQPDALRRITRALERQAIVANLRSHYTTDPGEHYGVGLDPYGRFSAPMREVVGVFLHQETVEAFGLANTAQLTRDPSLRERVVEAGNRSRELQRRVSDAGNRLVIDRLFRADLERPVSDRPERTATVMGIQGNKIHVSLDAPALDLKLYLRELGKVLGGIWLKPSEDGVSLLEEKTGKVLFSVGDALALRTIELDRQSDRWILAPRRLETV
jgi:ribonuclease R